MHTSALGVEACNVSQYITLYMVHATLFEDGLCIRMLSMLSEWVSGLCCTGMHWVWLQDFSIERM